MKKAEEKQNCEDNKSRFVVKKNKIIINKVVLLVCKSI